MHELIWGDCLEVLPSMPSQSVDAVIADPPYGTTACKWDSIIPLAPMWEQLKRVIKPSGAIVLFASQPFTSVLAVSNLDWFKYEIIWRKGNASGFVHAKNKPLKAHENILVFSSGTTIHKTQSVNRMTYNPQLQPGKPYRKMVTSVNVGMTNHAPSKANLDYVGTVLKNDGFRYPISIVEFSFSTVGRFHPTQKPTDLLRYLVRTYTNAGECILDFTMGSGSTGVAALLEGRRFIGIEKDQHYYEVARHRLDEAAGSSAKILPPQPTLQEALPYAD